MKSRFFAAAAAVTAVLVATAGQADAGPSQPMRGTSQVNGLQLQSALLPASAFGDSFYIKTSLNTGRKLLSTHVSTPLNRMSCGTFETTEIVSGFGNTAGATDEFDNTSWAGQYPNTTLFGYQDVVQFANGSAATSNFNQSWAKFAACRSYSTPDPGDSVPGGGQLLVTLDSLASTSVGHYRAFTAVLSLALSERPGMPFYADVFFAVAGTNVYYLWQVSGTNDPPTLMGSFIHRIQALYRR